MQFVALVSSTSPSNDKVLKSPLILNVLVISLLQSIFLLLFNFQIEIGSSLTSVMRRYLTGSNPILVFFSVFFELLRSEQIDESLVPPRVLNVLERSLATHSDCVLLWRMFAKLSKNPEAALTRASVNCPWSKAIACDRIRSGKEKIDDVLVFMQDKGLRLRTPVEEVRLLLAI